MPSKSMKQHRAMEAAAHGNSKLGIPKHVAEKYLAADKREDSHMRMPKLMAQNPKVKL